MFTLSKSSKLSPGFWAGVILILQIAVSSGVVYGGGEVDVGFAATAVRTRGSNVFDLNIKTSVPQPDGKLLIGGSFTTVGGFARKGIARLNADGTVDSGFKPPSLDKTIFFPWNLTDETTITGIGVKSDGKIVVAGDFNWVNGVSMKRLIRLNADGSLDSDFNNSLHQNLSQFEGTIYDIEILSDGKILLAGDNVSFLTQNFGRIIRPIVRLTAEANYDETFDDPNVFINMSLRKIVVQTDGRVLIAGSGGASFNNVGLARLNANGTLDFSFTGVNVGIINDFEVLQNGQIIIVGTFLGINGFPVGRIGRINPDGSVDLSFNTNNAGANNQLNSVAVETGGRLVIGGAFSSYNTVPKSKLIRLNQDGSLDSAFNYPTVNDGSVNVVEFVSGGKLFVGGEGGNWDRIQVLNSDGSFPGALDNLVGKGGLVKSLALQSDGKLLAGGRFVTASGATRNNLARYNLDGSIDSSFNPFVGEYPLFVINKVVVQPDGKVLVGTETPATFRRVNSDGTNDSSFTGFVMGLHDHVFDVLLLHIGLY
jgi:uncharacterized delta-60 repeat protein